MTTNDMLKKIYQELKESFNNSKEVGKPFIKTYTIPSINYGRQNNILEDHYFASGIEMELYNMLKNFNGEIDYFSYKDMYCFSNDKEFIKQHIEEQLENSSLDEDLEQEI